MQTLIQTFGTTVGMQKFVAAYPDATPFTIFRSTTAGLDSPPATKAALDVIDSHSSFFASHPYAGAYLLPPAGGAAYSKAAQAVEQADGMRVAKGWSKIVTEMSTAAASDAYYSAHDKYLTALAQAGTNTSERAQIGQGWSAWSKQFLAGNPLFAAALNSSTSAATRQTVLADMRSALSAGDVPAGAQTDQLRQLLDGYDAWKQTHDSLVGVRTSGATEQRTRLDEAFGAWSKMFSQSNPAVQAFYARIIVPELTTADRNVGQILEATNVGQ
jgi:hypothetical protein